MAVRGFDSAMVCRRWHVLKCKGKHSLSQSRPTSCSPGCCREGTRRIGRATTLALKGIEEVPVVRHYVVQAARTVQVLVTGSGVIGTVTPLAPPPSYLRPSMSCDTCGPVSHATPAAQ